MHIGETGVQRGLTGPQRRIEFVAAQPDLSGSVDQYRVRPQSSVKRLAAVQRGDRPRGFAGDPGRGRRGERPGEQFAEGNSVKPLRHDSHCRPGPGDIEHAHHATAVHARGPHRGLSNRVSARIPGIHDPYGDWPGEPQVESAPQPVPEAAADQIIQPVPIGARSAIALPLVPRIRHTYEVRARGQGSGLAEFAHSACRARPSPIVSSVSDLQGPAGDADDAAEFDAAERTADGGVIRSSAVMAVGTIVSRVTGVARDIAVAAALASGALADIYALGNSLPNIVYILVVGGALNAVFIPQLVRHMHADELAGKEFADRLITLTGLVLAALSAAAVVAAPLIVRLYATDEYSGAQMSMAVAVTRYCLPQIFFYGIYTMFSQVLNARSHFAAPMFAPIANNLVMITTAVGFIWITAGVDVAVEGVVLSPVQTAVLGIGTTLGVVVQAIALVPFLRRAGYRWRPRFDFRGHGLGRAGWLAGWTIGLVLVNQLGFIVISRLATSANIISGAAGDTEAGLAVYQRAYLMFMLPQSVITISLVTAMFPRMSKAAAAGELGALAQHVGSSMRLIGSLIAPCAAFLIVFGPAIGVIFFGWGRNEGPSALYTGIVVSAFAVGLLPFSLFYLLLRGWYSVEDTKRPFAITVIYNLIAMPLTLLLFYLAADEWKVISLALAYALAYWIVLPIAWFWVGRRLGAIQTRQTAGLLARAAVSAAAAAGLGLAAAYLVVSILDLLNGAAPAEIETGKLPAIACLIVGGLTAGLSYLVIARRLRVAELSQALAVAGGRLPGPLRRLLIGRSVS